MPDRFELIYSNDRYGVEYHEIIGANGARYLKIRLEGKRVRAVDLITNKQFGEEIRLLRNRGMIV